MKEITEKDFYYIIWKECGLSIHDIDYCENAAKKCFELARKMQLVSSEESSVDQRFNGLDDKGFIEWRDKYYEIFVFGRWELKDNPERGNWTAEELYEKYKVIKA